ncbi:Six-hairpin glycosidase [Aureobasidium pullulans]|uniref:Six-hairpin glycosidase n=1 Tax=Aureobasidium pullulans TaxID=5580 RepID=A0A4S9NQA4_AURPU|nr:Six-hairpin glycosidase [Aureobasidium pullulans]THY59496.1 Six-hairpin glycosidase [Aureobasidium pullulans]THZ19599.1 Six-hairpin glycosidase [Aureobasidium pullulans]
MVRLSNYFLPLFGTALFSQGTHAYDYLSHAKSGSDALMHWYNQDTGVFNGTGWWNSAECLTALAEMQAVDPKSDFLDTLHNTFEINKDVMTTKSDFYDDEGWWALLWIKAYDLTHNQLYLDAAEQLFDDMAKGWTTKCNGGIWWDKDKTYVNAIANELFLSVAAHLARRTWDIKYLNWAVKEWKWFEQSGMINENRTINDGLDGSCKNNGYTVWSYNQGVILGGLVELSKASFDDSYIHTAKDIAYAAIYQLTDSNGILHETCEKGCGGDVSQFKGIFMQQISQLYTATSDHGLKQFLEINAQSIWKNDRDSQNRLGLKWSGPFDKADASTHSSALMGLIAAASVQGV